MQIDSGALECEQSKSAHFLGHPLYVMSVAGEQD